MEGGGVGAGVGEVVAGSVVCGGLAVAVALGGAVVGPGVAGCVAPGENSTVRAGVGPVEDGSGDPVAPAGRTEGLGAAPPISIVPATATLTRPTVSSTAANTPMALIPERGGSGSESGSVGSGSLRMPALHAQGLPFRLAGPLAQAATFPKRSASQRRPNSSGGPM